MAHEISRTVNGQAYALSYNAANRLAASFLYDGDGNRVKSTIGSTTTTFVGNYYEVSGPTVTSYYYAGAQRIAELRVKQSNPSAFFKLCPLAPKSARD